MGQRDRSAASVAVDGSDGPRRLRVVSYNVFKGHYLGGGNGGGNGAGNGVRTGAARARRSLAADFAASPRLRGADVLLVQEALVGTLRRGQPSRDALGALARALDLGPDAPTRFLGEPHGHAARWGVAVLSRHAARFHDVPLPRARWSPWRRAAIVAEIGDFVVATLHLEVWPIGAPARKQQVAALLESLDAIPGARERPVLVAGDFNCEGGAAHHLMRQAGFAAAGFQGHTWSWGPFLRLRLDHAYLRGGRIAAAGVEPGTRGSDHRPIWVEVEAD